MKPFLSKSLSLLNSNPDDLAKSSVNFMNNNNYSEALVGFNQCLEISKTIDLNENFISDIYGNIGICHKKLGNYYQSSSNFISSYKLSPSIVTKINFWESISSEVNLTSSELINIHDYINYMSNESSDYNFEKFSTNLLDLFITKTGFAESLDSYEDFYFLNMSKFEFPDNDLRRFIHYPIVNYLLSNEIIKDINQEIVFSRLRYEFLKLCFNDSFKKNNIVSSFLLSLSNQYHLNEYIAQPHDVEKKLLNKLISKLNLSSNNINDNIFNVAVLSCYLPLNLYLNNYRDLLVNYNGVDDNFKSIIKLHFLDYDEINEIKNNYLSPSNIETLKNDVTKSVKNQYEDRPFPVWNCAKVSADKSLTYYDKVFELLNFNKINKPKKIANVLIAGCGTGQHGILRALECNDINFTAIDISSSSLAFAIKRAKELRVNNIKFSLEDINTYTNNEFKFDIIECVGVLHHLENPNKGLSNLNSLLADDGLLHLGLYSHKAREYMLGYCRDIINSNGLDKSNSSIIKFRELVLDDNININKIDYLKLSKFKLFRDFYSLSGLRDLLFHEHEIEYSTKQIKQLLIKSNFDFLCFQFRDYNLMKNKINDFNNKSSFSVSPNSLDNWDAFEDKYPTSFIEMYIMWLSKSDII